MAWIQPRAGGRFGVVGAGAPWGVSTWLCDRRLGRDRLAAGCSIGSITTARAGCPRMRATSHLCSAWRAGNRNSCHLFVTCTLYEFVAAYQRDERAETFGGRSQAMGFACEISGTTKGTQWWGTPSQLVGPTTGLGVCGLFEFVSIWVVESRPQDDAGALCGEPKLPSVENAGKTIDRSGNSEFSVQKAIYGPAAAHGK